MIKISNINFCEKTVENIEVSCDDMKEIKFEFLDNTLRLSIVKENDKEVIEEIIKEEMEDDEVVKEEPTEDVIEEKVIEKLTIDDLKKIIYETIPKKNTAETYFRTIKQVHDNFDEDDVNELLKKENEIIEFIETKYDKLSTIKNKLCGMLKVYNLLNLESNVLKSKIDHYMVSLSIQEDKKKEDPTDKKTIQEAELIVNYFKNELGMMEDMISKDVDILNTWDKTAQLYAVLKIYLTYGMLRPSEIMDMKITDTDEGNEQKNYINVVTKKMIIHNHKNDRKGTKVIDITDDTLNDILSRGLNNYLITNHSGEVYTSSSSFSKMFKSRFNDYNPYDLRKCISSLAIHEGDTEKINMLEHNQGHCLNTILKNYNTYNKVDVQ
jgi:integrase